MSKIAKQKGKLEPVQKTLKTMTHSEKLSERARELKMLKDGQTLTLMTIKSGK